MPKVNVNNKVGRGNFFNQPVCNSADFLMSIGVVGEYIGKIYLETKRRPRYIVSEFLNDT